MSINTRELIEELIVMGKNKIDTELKDYISLGYTKTEIKYKSLSSMGLYEIKDFVMKYWPKLGLWNNDSIDFIEKQLNKYARNLLN